MDRPFAGSDGYADLASQITALTSSYPPPFIFVHDPHTPRVASTTVCAALARLQQDHAGLALAHLKCDACFTPRLLYDTALNALAGWVPRWEDGCANWTGPLEGTSQRYNESVDGFTHGLRAVWNQLQRERAGEGADGQPNGRAGAELRLVLVLENAERLRETMPDLLAPLARLAELSRVPITTIFVSDLRWEHMRPSLGAAPDPYYIDVQSSSKQAIIHRLSELYPSVEVDDPSEDAGTGIHSYTYHPVFRPLYVHFLSTLYSVCSPFTTDLDDLAYVAAATWPAFIRPIIDSHEHFVQEQRDIRAREREQSREEDGVEPTSDAEPDAEPDIPLGLPSEDARMRLTRLITPALTAALEALYPRHTHAGAWAAANAPPRNLLALPPHAVPPLAARPGPAADAHALRRLPRTAKFVLVAAYLASTNPARTDMRIFGRGPEERAKRRRRGGSPRKMSAKAGAVKIPQRLLGPMPFPLDRMIAILGVLLEENDADVRPPSPQYKVPGEYTEMEISRTAVYGQIMELASMHLLHRTSPADRLEMSPTYKCGIAYDAALALAKDVGIKLNDIIWDPV